MLGATLRHEQHTYSRGELMTRPFRFAANRVTPAVIEELRAE
ncbi:MULTISPECIES: hypothetical protein [unclassified Streptomyces]